MKGELGPRLGVVLRHLFFGGWTNGLLCACFGAALMLLSVVLDRLGWLAFGVFAAAVVVLSVVIFKGGWHPAGEGWIAVGVWAGAVYRVKLQPGYVALISALTLGLVAVGVYSNMNIKEPLEPEGTAEAEEERETPPTDEE